MTGEAVQTPLVAPRKNPSLTDLARQLERKIKLETNVAYPCEVVAFDTSTQLVDVEADFSHVLLGDDSEQVLEPEVLYNMLVSHAGQGSSGGGYLTFPISPGDKGFVTVFDRSVERWISTGEGGDPNLRHTHKRIDGVFTPGLRDVTRAIPSFDQTAAVLEHTLIKLGANAVEAAVLGDSLKSYLDSLVAFVNSHTHAGHGVPVEPPGFVNLTDYLSDKVLIDAGSPAE